MRNLKKVVALVAVFAMLVSTVAFAQVFSDVADTDNYAEAIETLNALGIITGDDQDEDGVMDFRPADTITRAEVTAIISRIQGVNSAAQVNTEFTDVTAEHWASGYVAQAAGQGIVNGYGDGKFGPEDNVTYEQIVKMLMETLGYRPFADDNGGYPVGYTTAASRYGVLDDVIGGGIGVEANRGMVAQMVYNAIDTPLMDSVTYGAEKEYGIYDGVNRTLMTLLTRNLKMIKLTGKVVANSYTDGIDTDAEKIIKVAPAVNSINKSYLGVDQAATTLEDVTLYQGDIDADDLLGYSVELYAAKNTAKNRYTLVAIVAEASSETVSFTLDQYRDFKNNKVEYAKDATSSSTTTKAIASNATIIYNGVQADEELTAGDYFGNLIKKNGNLSGKVTLMDTDDTAGMDVVRIEVGVSAVVKEVTSRGQIRFKNTSVKVPYVDSEGKVANASVKLAYDEEDTGLIINLTKDGEAIDYSELKEWDVVTVVWCGEDLVYNVRVLGEANYVDAAVSVVKSDDDITLSDGNTYEIAAAAYDITKGDVEPGLAGRFFIDEYGKIVALDKTIDVEGSKVVTDKYAYVLNAQIDEANWGEAGITVQILDKSGEIYEAILASKVKFVNFDQKALKYTDATGAEATLTDDSKTLEIADAFNDTQMEALKNALLNNLIAYEGNSAGEIKTIVLPGDAEEEDLMAIGNKATAVYDADTMSFNGTDIMVNADTVVFYIKGDNDITFATATEKADKDKCSIATGADLVEGTYKHVYAFDPNSNDEAKVLVLMNQEGKIAASTSLAVIDSVGTSVVNGTDVVYTVNYYMDGELKTATTEVGMTDEDVIAAAKRGDLYKFAMTGDVITSIKEIATFKRAGAGSKDYSAYLKDATAAPAFDTLLTGAQESSEEVYYFGALTKANNSSFTLTFLDKGTAKQPVLTRTSRTATQTYTFTIPSTTKLDV